MSHESGDVDVQRLLRTKISRDPQRKELGNRLLACLLTCSHQGAAGT